MVDSNLHVITHEEEGWAIKREGRKEPLSTHPTQRDAIEAALDVAHNEETNVVIHRRDGRIREVRSYNGNDEDIDGADRTPASTSTTSRRQEGYSPLASLGSRIRWGSVFAGFFTSLATSLALTALGTALTLSLANAFTGESLRVFAGTWAMVTLLVSLFLGGYVISRLTVGESDVVEPTIYGTLLWALMFSVLPLLPLAASNIGFGSFMGQSQQQQASSPGLTPDQLMEAGLTEEQAQTVSEMSTSREEVSSLLSENATEAAWLTFAAMLVSLAAAIGGSLVGSQTDEDHLLVRRRVTT